MSTDAWSGIYIGYWKANGQPVYAVARIFGINLRDYLPRTIEYANYVDCHWGRANCFYASLSEARNAANKMQKKQATTYGVVNIGQFHCTAPNDVINFAVKLKNKKPVNSSFKFWVVLAMGHGYTPIQCVTYEGAVSESKALAQANPGVTFTVLEAVGEALTEQTIKTTFTAIAK